MGFRDTIASMGNRLIQMQLLRTLPVVLTLALLPSAAHSEETAKNIPWEWTDAELRKIDKIEKKVKRGDDGYWFIEEKEYVAYSNISPRFTAELSLYMDLFFDTFPRIFEVPPNANMLLKIHTFVHRTREEYSSRSNAPPWSGGVFIPQGLRSPGRPQFEIHAFPWHVEEGGEITFCKNFKRGVMQHEGTHAMLQRFAGKSEIPDFFNEGCASYFEVWNLRERKGSEEERTGRALRGFHLDAIAEKMARDPKYRPNLYQCLEMDHMQWGSGEIGLHYGLAESFVDFLLSSKQGRKVFEDMVEASYKRVASTKGVKDLLDRKKIEELEPLWHEHIDKLLALRKSNGGTAGSARVSLDVQNAALPDILKIVSAQTDLIFRIENKAGEGKLLGMRAQNLPVEHLFERLSELCGVDFLRDGQTVRVVPKGGSKEGPAEPDPAPAQALLKVTDIEQAEMGERLGRKDEIQGGELALSDVVAQLETLSGLDFAIGEGMDDSTKIKIPAGEKAAKDLVPFVLKALNAECKPVDGVLTFTKK